MFYLVKKVEFNYLKFIPLQIGTKATDVNDAVPSILLKLIHMHPLRSLCHIFRFIIKRKQ